MTFSVHPSGVPGDQPPPYVPPTPGPTGSRPSGPPPPPPNVPPRSRRRWFWWGCLPVIVLVLLVVVLAAGLLAYQRGSSDVERTNGTALPAVTVTTPVPGSAAVTASCAVQQGLITRDCAIITPPSVAAGERLPVVFLLHGFGEGPVDVRGQGDWADAVVARRFMLVTPSGVANSWNAGGCCGIAKGTGIDDVAYLDALVTEISRRPDVDPDRVFMAGFSNGGMMVYRYLCVASDRLRAAASVAGTKSIDCGPKGPIPFLHIHGTADETVPYEGGAGPMAAVLGSNFAPVPKAVAEFAAADGCQSAPQERTEGDLTTKEWDGCGADVRVKFITIAGWTHIWPLTGPLDATAELLDFFGIR